MGTFWCRLGFHKGPIISKQLIATGGLVCLNCGRGWTTYWGEIWDDLPKSDCEQIIKGYKDAHSR